MPNNLFWTQKLWNAKSEGVALIHTAQWKYFYNGLVRSLSVQCISLGTFANPPYAWLDVLGWLPFVNPAQLWMSLIT